MGCFTVATADPLSIRPFSWATGYSDELCGLSRAQASLRVRESRRILEDLFERPVSGFVPPAGDVPSGRPEELFDAGYTYGLGLTSLVHRADRVKVATRSWDPGKLGAVPLVGRALSAFGAVTLALLRETRPKGVRTLADEYQGSRLLAAAEAMRALAREHQALGLYARALRAGLSAEDRTRCRTRMAKLKRGLRVRRRAS